MVIIKAFYLFFVFPIEMTSSRPKFKNIIYSDIKNPQQLFIQEIYKFS